MQLQGGGGRQRDGGPPARAQSSVGELTTDDNAADVRARPRDPGKIQTTPPSPSGGGHEHGPGPGSIFLVAGRGERTAGVMRR
ncbi:hypothetical protein GEV49_24795 [Streptomyces sp. SYP-A7193]|nr:hypothetical protein GEV49_24795 [Streptomyces sp. SYP-A7193]